MKRNLSVLFILCMLITLAACGKGGSVTDPTSAHTVTQEPETGSVAETEQDPSPASTTEETTDTAPSAGSETEQTTDSASVSETESLPEGLDPTSAHTATEAPETGSAAETEQDPSPASTTEETPDTAPSAGSETGSLPAEPDPQTYRDKELSGIFEEVMNIRPGSAGSSISAAACAVKLLDWGAGTQLNDDGIRSVTETWLEDQDEANRELFKESIRLVRSTCSIVRDKDTEFIKSYTGIDSDFCPWDDRTFSILETVFSVCGLE